MSIRGTTIYNNCFVSSGVRIMMAMRHENDNGRQGVLGAMTMTGSMVSLRWQLHTITIINLLGISKKWHHPWPGASTTFDTCCCPITRTCPSCCWSCSASITNPDLPHSISCDVTHLAFLPRWICYISVAPQRLSLPLFTLTWDRPQSRAQAGQTGAGGFTELWF